jgi:hypothetical protein
MLIEFIFRWLIKLRDRSVWQELGDILQSRPDSDDNFQPIGELEGVSNQETADGVAVIRPVVLGFAQAVHHHKARRKTALEEKSIKQFKFGSFIFSL